MRERMELETPEDKKKKAICHSIQLLIILIPTIVWAFWMVNANSIDSMFTDWCDSYKSQYSSE